MLIEADATRTDGLLTLRLIGQSPVPFEAKIVDYYPGTLIYDTDPFSAQIFISEERNPELENLSYTPLLGKIWHINQVIYDKYHKTVEIFVNGYLVRKIRVIEHTVHGITNIH
jgi:hypothetical protein